MNLPLMALAVVLLLVVWLFLRRRQASRSDDSKPEVRAGSSTSVYHAVSIKFSGSACDAAREMKGRRFLSTAAPKLPLAECDNLECNCRFVHHKDRRSDKDRRSPFGPSGLGGGTGSYEKEQRSNKDRRAEIDEDLY
ncbi:MAG: hypothetical protein OEU90_08715 [Gammaproteobacteria bacterium]|nr:hypothetical protein [Gammaproteobacteria bacterium]MDH3750038.1 hypothetical protein [Gammaproteobacteria bacterium]MDH3805538.1 hypothetical protein [Gammaproteobacteria bacterium]